VAGSIPSLWSTPQQWLQMIPRSGPGFAVPQAGSVSSSTNHPKPSHSPPSITPTLTIADCRPPQGLRPRGLELGGRSRFNGLEAITFSPEAGVDRVASVHRDGGGGGVRVGDVPGVAGPLPELIAFVRRRHQLYHSAGIVGPDPLSRDGHCPSTGAGNSQLIGLNGIVTGQALCQEGRHDKEDAKYGQVVPATRPQDRLHASAPSEQSRLPTIPRVGEDHPRHYRHKAEASCYIHTTEQGRGLSPPLYFSRHCESRPIGTWQSLEPRSQPGVAASQAASHRP